MLEWFTRTVLGRMTATFVISMVPIVELRGGLPYGIALGLQYPVALACALVGNFLPVPFIIIYIKRIFAWLRKKNEKFNRIVTALETKAHLKGRIVTKYRFIGLVILVGIPLPGTGAWTGALVAAVLDMRAREAIPAILLGLLMAAAIITAATFGIIHLI